MLILRLLYVAACAAVRVSQPLATVRAATPSRAKATGNADDPGRGNADDPVSEERDEERRDGPRNAGAAPFRFELPPSSRAPRRAR